MRRHVLILCIISALALGASAAMAADVSDAAWNDAYDALLHNPTDPVLNKHYLELCLQRSNYEAAIAPIERLLMQDPTNVALTLQLGKMYQLLGSHKVAQGYFDKVIAAPNATDQLRAEATTLSKQ